MLSHEYLEKRCFGYAEWCSGRNKSPTKSGLAKTLGISNSTICRVLCGNYADGRAYTRKPHYNRLIANNDFKLLEMVFER